MNHLIMDTWLAGAVGFALSQVILSTLLLLNSNRWMIQQKLYASLLIAVSGYLAAPYTGDGFLIWIVTPLLTAVPGLFWLFSASLFDDHFVLKFWHLSMVAITVCVPMASLLIEHLYGVLLSRYFFVIPQLLEVVLLILTLMAVAQHWKIDLIEPRRRLRLWFCGLTGLYILILISLREVFFAEQAWFSSFQYLPVGGLLLVINALFLEYKNSIWQYPASLSVSENPDYVHGSSRFSTETDSNTSDTEMSPLPDQKIGQLKTSATEVRSISVHSGNLISPIEDSAADKMMINTTVELAERSHTPSKEMITRLHALMEKEQLFREMGLTIGKLASQMEMPEYRLRQLINTELGYRNFNDFLNRYRIRDASSRLADKAQINIPVLTIALDSGFRSLSSFNKVFKETYGVTPKAYRQELVSDCS